MLLNARSHIAMLLKGLPARSAAGRAALRAVFGLSNTPPPPAFSPSGPPRSRVMTAPVRAASLLLFLALIALGGGLLALHFAGASPAQAQDGSVPDQPTGLSAEASHNRVNLTWDDPNDDSVTHYQVLRRDRDVHDTGEFVTIESDTGSAATSYADDAVEPETRYVYRVVAVNDNGVSKWSKFERADTPAAPQPDPTPGPTPAPTPEPTPAPTPEPTPAPTPEPTPEPTPAPTPEPTPEPTPAPTPEPTPEPTPAPTPEPNTPATGAPTISGTVEVGETLTADTSGIYDADGLDDAVFSYQWSRNDESADADISGATDSTYTLVDTDAGKTIKVRVGFIDDGSNPESLTSTATAPVATAADETEPPGPIWSATLTVGRVGDNYGYQSFLNPQVGSLVPATFVLDDVTYTIGHIETAADYLTVFGVDRDLPVGFTLELDGAQFESSDASLTSTTYSHLYTWLGRGTDWDVGEEVTALLVASPTLVVPVDSDLAPSNLKARGSGEEVTLTWTAPAEDAGSVTGYEVLRGQGSAALTTLAADTGSTDTAYTDSGVTGDLDDYRYQVKALRGGDASQGSNVDGVLQSAHAGAIVPLADVTLISNLGQSSQDGGNFSNDQAQAFTTGSNSGGYSLTKVVIDSLLSLAADFTVSVHENDSGAPGTSLGTLTKPTLPATGQAAEYEFTHSGIDLAASTTYFIVVDSSASSASHIIYNTNSDAEDTGGATGWSIGDSSLYRGFGSTGSWTTWAQSKRISITGTVTGGTTNNAATGAPTITGTPEVGELLTADTSNIGDPDGIADADFEYQWIADDGTTDSDISGATGETYRPLLAHLGQTIKVRVSFTDDEGNAESLTSAATAAVTASTYGQVIWAATVTVGTDTASAAGFTGDSFGYFNHPTEDSFGAIDHSMFTHSGVNYTVSGIHYVTLSSSGVLVSNKFSVVVNGSLPDSAGFRVSGKQFPVSEVTTTSTDAQGIVTYVWDDAGLTWTDGQEVEVRLTVNRPATGAPAISGTLEVGETLTADVSAIMDEDGVPAADQFAYQWISNDGTDDSDIDGATDSTYTLVEADAGKTITVRVSFTDDAKFPESLTSAAVTVPVAALVSNVGQTAGGNVNVTATQSQAQGFTTGSDSGGYTLGSVELAVSSFSGTASDITVSIYSESSGNPGTLVHTLTTPASISTPVTTFTAPSGTTLAAGTTYYVVVSTTGSGITLSRTSATAEDTGGVSGWSIADSRRYLGSGAWITTTSPIRMRVNGAAATAAVLEMGVTEVPADSSLVPDGLGPGDQFRLIFLSSETRTAVPTDIARYNAWVQGLAANGHADIQDHSSTFRVVGSTAAVDARDNTSTTYTSSDKGVAIYWLNGDKAADEYEDFYDETWDEEASMRDESGTTVTPIFVFTGSNHDGTKTGQPLGNTGLVTLGQPNSTFANEGPLSSDISGASTGDSHLYALSGVFQVGAIEVPADWSLVPSGLQEGDQFRLLFISSAHRNASPSEIATYNTWVQDLAANGHTDIQDYSSSFRAVGSTEDMDARDNTGTTYTSSDKGVAIYWLGGKKVADDYEDFYDEDWDEEAAMKNESGTAEHAVTAWTGSDHDGTEAFNNNDNTSRALGNSGNHWVRYGKADSASHGPLSGATASRNNNRRIYGLSGVFEVVAANNPATGKPTISGTPEVNQTLTADISSIMDADGLPAAGQFSYQWISDDSDIDGATGSTYTLVQADAGKTIKVRVSFTDSSNFPESLTSAATATVLEMGVTEVPSTWSLIPSGLGVGDEFRLLFVSSTTRNATPTGISTYNTWIQNRAAAGHTDIQDYSDTFRVRRQHRRRGRPGQHQDHLYLQRQGRTHLLAGRQQGGRRVRGLLRRGVGRRSEPHDGGGNIYLSHGHMDRQRRRRDGVVYKFRHQLCLG